MPLTIPPGVSADGSVKVQYVVTIADTSAPKVATEIKAASSVEASCLLTKDGFAPDATTSQASDERLCSKQVFEDYGTVTYTLADITYVYDVQNPTSASNKFYAAVPEGSTGFLVVRWGQDADDDWAVGDVVDVYPVKMGPQIKQPPETNSKLKVKQKPFVVGNVAIDVITVT
jgi:hypothetical protein